MEFTGYAYSSVVRCFLDACIIDGVKSLISLKFAISFRSDVFFSYFCPYFCLLCLGVVAVVLVFMSAVPGFFLISMKKTFIIFVLAFFAAVSAVQAKGKEEKAVYMFGASFSFSDSVVYFTEIMPVEGAKLDTKTKFLLHRQYYAYELKDYMNFQENMPGRTSVIYFSEKRSKLEKQEAKIKKRLVEKEGKTVRYLGDKFKFVKP